MKNVHRIIKLNDAVAATIAVLLWPASAGAHLVTTGLGPVYDGIGHLVMTPEDLIPVLALAVYAGLQGAAMGRRALFFLPLAWFCGGLVGLAADGLAAPPIPAISFIFLGILIAADLQFSKPWFTAVAIGMGAIHGLFNGMALKSGPGVLGLLGILAALLVIVTLTSALVVSLRRPWARIVVRVAGSWTAAIGILMLGWAMKGPL